MEGVELTGPQSMAVMGEEPPCSAVQEQRFFSAFQAAVERQTGIVLPHQGVRPLQQLVLQLLRTCCTLTPAARLSDSDYPVCMAKFVVARDTGLADS